MNIQRLIPVAVLVVAGWSSGCKDEGDDASVVSYSVPKEPERPSQAAQAAAMVPQWTVPAGWKPLPAGGMRHAAYAMTEDEPPVTLTVIPLPSSPLLANVNRWEGELGLPPSKEDDLGKVSRHVDVGDLHIDIVDLTGPKTSDKPQQRTLAAIVPHGGKTWFFKAMGPAEKVGAQRENFERFIKSLRFAPAATQPAGAAVAAGEATTSAGQASAAASAGSTGLKSFTKPATWRQDTQKRAMREMTFFVGPESGPAEVIVSRMGTSFGGILANINRWRQQVGLGPLKSENEQAKEVMQLDGSPAARFDLNGPGSAPGKPMRQIVLLTVREDGAWFFKILGPADVVEQNKGAFDEFVKSVRFNAPAVEQ